MAFSPKARFVHGSPQMLDHTPAAAVAAGDVVVLGGICQYAHSDIAVGANGALACPNGDGVYDVLKGSAVFADRAKVYWDATAKLATATSTSNTLMGLALGAAATGDATVRILALVPAAAA